MNQALRPIENSLESKIFQTFQLMSSVSGLPITSHRVFPEDPGMYPVDSEGTPLNILPFHFEVVLGEEPEEYTFTIELNYVRDRYGDSYDDWGLEYSNSLKFNNKEISSRPGSVMGYKVGPFNSWEITSDVIREARLHYLDRELGGVDKDLPWMDYEKYSFKSLLYDGFAHDDPEFGEHSYFANLYLLFMTHLKERGVPLPPIIGRDREVWKNADLGEVELVQEAVTRHLDTTSSQEHWNHVRLEGEVYIDEALRKNRLRNPEVPLESSFEGEERERMFIKSIEGRPLVKPQTVLALQDLSLYSGNVFIENIYKTLNMDRRFGGSTFVGESALCYCYELLETGQIDTLILDGLVRSSFFGKYRDDEDFRIEAFIQGETFGLQARSQSLQTDVWRSRHDLRLLDDYLVKMDVSRRPNVIFVDEVSDYYRIPEQLVYFAQNV